MELATTGLARLFMGSSTPSEGRTAVPPRKRRIRRHGQAPRYHRPGTNMGQSTVMKIHPQYSEHSPQNSQKKGRLHPLPPTPLFLLYPCLFIHQIVAHALLRAASRLLSTPAARDKIRGRTDETPTYSPLNPDSPWKTTPATLGMLELPWRVPLEK